MEYLLRNGKKVFIRKPGVEDAEAIVNIITIADTETLFLARNPGEFCTSVERDVNDKKAVCSLLNFNIKELFIDEQKNKAVSDV